MRTLRSILDPDFGMGPYDPIKAESWLKSNFTCKGLKFHQDGSCEAESMVCLNRLGVEEFPPYVHVTYCEMFSIDGAQQWKGTTWPDKCYRIYLNELYHLETLKGAKCDVLVFAASRPPKDFGLKRGDVKEYRLISFGYNYNRLEQQFKQIGAKEWG